jgi:hypothetical protein
MHPIATVAAIVAVVSAMPHPFPRSAHALQKRDVIPITGFIGTADIDYSGNANGGTQANSYVDIVMFSSASISDCAEMCRSSPKYSENCGGFGTLITLDRSYVQCITPDRYAT